MDTDNNIPHPSLGWHFTPDEEYRMLRAIRASKIFMTRYGRGLQPYSAEDDDETDNP